MKKLILYGIMTGFFGGLGVLLLFDNNVLYFPCFIIDAVFVGAIFSRYDLECEKLC